MKSPESQVGVVGGCWVVAVVAGGRDEGHTVFRRCAAPEKIRIFRTEGSNSGELKAGKKTEKKRTKSQKKTKKRTKVRKIEQKAQKMTRFCVCFCTKFHTRYKNLIQC